VAGAERVDEVEPRGAEEGDGHRDAEGRIERVLEACTMATIKFSGLLEAPQLPP
jgi:hypothetical protein